MRRESVLDPLFAAVVCGLLCWLSFRAYGKACMRRDSATKLLLAGSLLVIGWVMLIGGIVFAGCGVNLLTP